MLHRRQFLAPAAAIAFLTGTSSARAWSWSWGGGGGSWRGTAVQAAGEIVSEARPMPAFESIRVSGHFKVRVRQDGREAVTLQADRNLLPLIETRVRGSSEGGLLEIGLKSGYSLRGLPVPELVVDVKTLRDFTLAGSGDVRIDSLKSERFDLSLSGSGDVILAGVQVPRLGVRVAGSGDVSASGRSQSLTVSVSGSGDVKAAELPAEEVRVNVAGSGNVQVHALRNLKVSIAGSGDVRYAGAAQVESSMAGSGSVRPLKGS
ncbi:MAG: head GIN domain-containing protein [Rubrivivax sp.]